MSKEKRLQDVSRKWYVILPAIGLCHALLDLMGWIRQGSGLNFILFLGVGYLWLFVILKETQKPFAPLVWMGGIYGILYASFELYFWFLNGGLMGLGRPNRSFEDLLESIFYFISPFFIFFVRIIYGLMIGALIGLMGSQIAKYQNTKK